MNFLGIKFWLVANQAYPNSSSTVIFRPFNVQLPYGQQVIRDMHLTQLYILVDDHLYVLYPGTFGSQGIVQHRYLSRFCINVFTLISVIFHVPFADTFNEDFVRLKVVLIAFEFILKYIKSHELLFMHSTQNNFFLSCF